MTASTPDRWTPDHQLVPAVLAGSPKRMADLCAPDRAWVVAGLGIAGLTAEEIADRLECSLRLVRSIRALDMTMVCHLKQVGDKDFGNEVALVRSEMAAVLLELEQVNAELARCRTNLNRLIDEKITGCPSCRKCGTPMDKVNTYLHPGTGRKHCRACHARRQQKYRGKTVGPVEVLLTA